MFLGAVRAAGSAGKGNRSAAPSDNEAVLQLYLTSLQLLHHPLPLHYWIFAAVKEPGRGFLLCRRNICSCCENRRKFSTPLPRLAKEQEEGSCGAKPACHRTGNGSSVCMELPGSGLWLATVPVPGEHQQHQCVNSQISAFPTGSKPLTWSLLTYCSQRDGDNTGVLACAPLSPML